MTKVTAKPAAAKAKAPKATPATKAKPAKVKAAKPAAASKPEAVKAKAPKATPTPKVAAKGVEKPARKTALTAVQFLKALGVKKSGTITGE